MSENLSTDNKKLVSKLVQSASELKSKVSSVIQPSEQAETLINFIEQRIHQLGDSLRDEMQQISEKYRSEMEQVYLQKQQQLRREAMYQWFITLALLIAMMAKNSILNF
jgi:predicted nucleic acid-binding Zn ribbon protein